MATSNDPRTIVKSYFDAWTNKRTAEAYALLAPNLEFRGPSAHYTTAEEFRPGLEGFAKMTSAARVVDLLVDGDRVAMLYEADLPEPVGTLRIASFFRVENGKIRTYETQFDATEFRKLLAKLQGG